MNKCSNDYIFPILNDTVHKTEAQRYRRRKKVLRNVNANLIAITKMLNIDIDLTTYVARHTFATLLVSSGSEIYTVSKILTHKNVSTTQIYADLIDEKKRQSAETIKIKPNKKV